MTGYAKVQSTLATKKVNIEIKTLNSKQLDLIVKLPAAYRGHELDIRTLLSRLERGKVECTLSEENSLAAAAGFNQELRDSDWAILAADIERAIDLTDQFRSHEGDVLERDFHRHIDLIEQMLGEIPQYESQRIDTAKERIRRWMADADVKAVDENRFEQELIYYLEKLDITEEKVRLQKHIDYFRQTMASEPSCGKKLGFVTQEMGREINTTGSKANHVEIQRLVVVMKDELEKIKEQLGNVL